MQHVIDLQKMFLPSLNKLIIESTTKITSRAKEKDDYMRELQLNNLQLKELVEKDVLWMKVEQAAENENKWRKQAEEAVAVLAKQVEEKSATPLERLRKKLSMLRKVGSLGY